MKQAYKGLAIVVFLFGLAGQVAAQKVAPPYAIGIRANPDGAGISAKYFFNENINIDAMLNNSRGASGYRNHSTVFLGLVEYNFLLANPSWRIFVGPAFMSVGKSSLSTYMVNIPRHPRPSLVSI